MEIIVKKGVGIREVMPAQEIGQSGTTKMMDYPGREVRFGQRFHEKKHRPEQIGKEDFP